MRTGFKTIQGLVDHIKEFSDRTAVSFKDQNGFRYQKSFIQLHNQVVRLSAGLLKLGLQKGDRVAIFSSNIPEWLTLTLAINYAGCIDVPRGENSNVDEINYILEHSRARVVFVENLNVFEKVNQDHHPHLIKIFSIQPISECACYLDLFDAKVGPQDPAFFVVEPEDSVSIIYTSGTTGVPKGVELRHRNFVSQLAPLLKRVTLKPQDKCLSILPAWHVFERIVKYLALTAGVETFYSKQSTLMADLEFESPTVMASVPRIWEVIYDRVIKKVKQAHAVKQLLFDLAYQSSLHHTQGKEAGAAKSLMRLTCHKYLEKTVYSELRKRLGNRLRFPVSGGSALPSYIDDFFYAAGIPILEGYGLTETSPVISVRVPGQTDLYNTGPIIDGYEAVIRNSETGDVLPSGHEGVLFVRGAGVMKGYYRQYDETRRVLDGGDWLDTGDRGFINLNGRLVITGREKDIIVLSNGENINPIPIEICLQKSPYIATAIVTGQDWRLLSALIVPDLEMLKNYCLKQTIAFDEQNIVETLRQEKIYEFYKQEIASYISLKNGFSHHERIYDFRFAAHFEVGRELTITLKPKRAVIETLYKSELDSMRVSVNRRG